MKRQEYLRELRRLIPEYGSENIVYFDETGFEQDVRRDAGWAPRGQKIHGNFRGKKQTRTNLLMAQSGKKWLAPMLFEGMCEAGTVLSWIKQCLLKELYKPSVIIMDNAPVHNKKKIRELLEEKGHKLLCLPKYSPDFNPIEQTFGALKINWKNTQNGTPIDMLFV